MSFRLDSLDLPEGLFWEDPYSWNPVGQQIDVALAGSLIVQESAQLQGRPIVLKGGQEYCWLQRSLVDSLYALLGTPDLQMSLNLGTLGTHTVIWDRSDPLKVVSFVPFDDETGTTLYYIESLKFIKVG